MFPLQKIVSSCNANLRISEIGDWDNAPNGLQIENSGKISKLGAADDASSRTLSLAAKAGVDFMLVHHGLYWQGLQPVTGILRRHLRAAFDHDVAVYSVHLPLDVLPVFSNNAQLAAAIGLRYTPPV